MNSFNNDAIDGFKAFVKCGGSRDQVVREISEHIYVNLDWKSNWDRSELLEKIINLVYN